MPFTVSHVAAVLPLVAGRRTARLPSAALVIGSMVPDVPWFFTAGRGAALTHSPRGVVTVDLVVGLTLFALWRLAFAAPARDLLPPAVGTRLPLPRRPRGADWVLAGLGVLLGAATHVLWDSFTHDGRWGVRHVAWLQDTYAGLPGSVIAQYASSLIGLGVLAVWTVRRLTHAEPLAAPVRPVTAGERATVWAAVVLAGAGVAAASGAVALARSASVEVAMYTAVTRGGAAAVAVVTLMAVLWHVRRIAGPVSGSLAEDDSG